MNLVFSALLLGLFLVHIVNSACAVTAAEDPCSIYKTHRECIQMDSCGWCSSDDSAVCVSGNKHGPNGTFGNICTISWRFCDCPIAATNGLGK